MTAQGQEKVLTVVVDTEGPSVTRLKPATDSVYQLRPVLSASISDNAGEPAAISYQQFSKEASRISATLVLHTIALL